MRKRQMTPIPLDVPSRDEGWLDLDRLAVVEVTSEDKDYPVESALVAGGTQGWRAAESGSQTIRLIFDQPQRLTRNALVFEETETPRSQEFVLRWSEDTDARFGRLCASSGISISLIRCAKSEVHQVGLSDVTVLELVLVPDISRRSARASLKSLRVS